MIHNRMIYMNIMQDTKIPRAERKIIMQNIFSFEKIFFSLCLGLAATLITPIEPLKADAYIAEKKAKKKKGEGIERPAIFNAVINCRKIIDDSKRLACYDQRVTALDDATEKEDILVADKKSVNEARRGLFGHNTSNLKLFKSDKKEQVREVSTTIKAARKTKAGAWIIQLEDGAKWRQIDRGRLIRAPKKGTPIKIRKAALGSYLANVDGQRAIRVKRIN